MLSQQGKSEANEAHGATRGAPAGDLYRKIVERIDDGLLICDLDGSVLVSNDSITALTGRPRDQWLAGNLSTLGLPDALTRHLLNAGMDGTAPMDVEIRAKSGDRIPVLVSATRATYGQREVVYVFLRDLREAKHAEKVARESGQLVQEVLQNIPMGIHLYRLAPDGGLIFEGGNRAADRILGVDNAQFIGKAIEEAFPQLKGTEIPARYREVARTGAPWSTRQVTYEDTRIRGAFEVHAFRTGENRMAAVFADVTERHQLEERLRHAEKMETVGQLTGGLVHDFNNQLTAIMGYADLFVMQLTDPNLKEFAATILAAAKRSSQLTHKLLSYIRQHASQSVCVNVHSILDEVFTVLKHSVDKRITFQSDFKADPSTTRGDPSLLQNAFLNLAINACDAMSRGGTLKVTTDVIALGASHRDSGLKSLAPGLYLVAQFQDTGSGMPAEVKEKLFTPFFTTKRKGTGLGLSSVLNTVRLHAGTVTVESEVGKGSAFSVYLPVEEKAGEECAGTGGGIASMPPLRVLVVDDEEMVRTMVARMLERGGHKAICEADGAAAIERYRQCWRELDVVLLDVNMPRVGGLDTFLAMRDVNPGVRVVLFSGFGLTPELEQILEPRKVEFLSKPFRQSEMYERFLSTMAHRT